MDQLYQSQSGKIFIGVVIVVVILLVIYYMSAAPANSAATSPSTTVSSSSSSSATTVSSVPAQAAPTTAAPPTTATSSPASSITAVVAGLWNRLPNYNYINGQVNPASNSADGNVRYIGTSTDVDGCESLCGTNEWCNHYTLVGAGGGSYANQCFGMTTIPSKASAAYGVNSGSRQ